jgi:hypothetical protein
MLWNPSIDLRASLLLFFKLIQSPQHRPADSAGAVRHHRISGDALEAGKQETESPNVFFHGAWLSITKIPVRCDRILRYSLPNM